VELSERMIFIRKSLGLNQTIFAQSLGLQQGSYSDIERGRVKTLSESVIRLLQLNYNINRDWLTGKSEVMSVLNTEPAKSEQNAKKLPFSEFVTTAPLISQYAHAGYLEGYADTEYIEQQPVYVASKKYSNGNYVAFEIRGDSMDDGLKRSICNSDVVLGRELTRDYWKCKLHIPKIFIIVHTREGIICKEIVEHNVDNATFRCHSFNPEYEDFELNLKDVVKLFYIKEIKREP